MRRQRRCASITLNLMDVLGSAARVSTWCPPAGGCLGPCLLGHGGAWGLREGCDSRGWGVVPTKPESGPRAGYLGVFLGQVLDAIPLSLLPLSSCPPHHFGRTREPGFTGFAAILALEDGPGLGSTALRVHDGGFGHGCLGFVRRSRVAGGGQGIGANRNRIGSPRQAPWCLRQCGSKVMTVGTAERTASRWRDISAQP